ncbi:DUF4906 domain-containing protein [Alistipes finegoldii]|uniref:DUF4906 domain-containing protein n=1 Tax=Alistipes finegoldii TaxID=214856 RepID=UPI003AB31C25
MKYLLNSILSLILLSGCQQFVGEICPDGRTVSVTLELQPEQPAAEARATDENTIQDVNLYLYGNGQSYHFYATGASHQIDIDIVPGNYSIHAAVNQHKDLGDLPYSALINYRTDAPREGTLTMYGYVYQKIDLATKIIQVSVKRNAAKIAYNITVTPDKEIEILSVQLCSMPNKDYLICEDQMDLTDPSYGFYDSEVRILPEGAKSASGLFYMLSNRRGENSTIKDQKQKNAENAPENASFFRIRGRSGENKIVDYIVYLGANNTSDFNVWPNEAHTYNITLSGDNETDTRITSYLFEFYSSWPRSPYCIPGDYGEFSVRNGNNSDHTFTGKLEVTQGDAESFRYGDGGAWHEGALHDVYIPAKSDARGDMDYTPALIKKGVNQTLAYRLTITDEQGEAIRFEASQEFANMVRANFQAGTGSVTVSGELAKAAGTNYVLAYCYEDGCTFTAVDGNGYAFDGWYADQAYTQLLSTKAVYKHAPTKGQDAIYARFALIKQPKVEISCNQTNKNSTYMFNKNTVTMTVTDFSGPVTIEASCAAGGIFTSATSFSKTVVSGQSFTLDPIVFVPTATGNISYTIDVTTSTGIKIGSKTVTNNIAATKLTPTIQIGYGGKTRQALYKPANTISSVYWYGYTTVIAQVTFSPTLDYPAPIESAQLLKIQLYPSHQVSRVVGVDDPGSGYWGVQFSWPEHPDITVPAFEAIEAKYGAEPENTYTLAATAEITHSPGTGAPLFAPFTEGETFLVLPGLESEALDAKMMDREFVKYTFTNPIKPNAVTISPIYHKSDLQIESSFSKITIINNLN